MQIWGMGIASQDLTGDGLPEVYLTSQGDNKLQSLASGPTQPAYGDIALAPRRHRVPALHGRRRAARRPPGIPSSRTSTTTACIDLFVSKGNVGEVPDYAMRDPSNLFLGQPDGTFAEGAEAAGIVSFDSGRGAALADFNQDGLLDLVESNLGAPVRIWRNVGGGSAEAPVPMGGWLSLRLSQPGRQPRRDRRGDRDEGRRRR